MSNSGAKSRTAVPKSIQFGNTVRTLRQVRKMSLQDVASPIFTRASIHLIEKGESGASEKMIQHLSKKFDVSREQLTSEIPTVVRLSVSPELLAGTPSIQTMVVEISYLNQVITRRFGSKKEKDAFIDGLSVMSELKGESIRVPGEF